MLSAIVHDQKQFENKDDLQPDLQEKYQKNNE